MVETIAWQLLIYAGILFLVLGGTLLVSRYDSTTRGPRHEPRTINEILVGVHVFALFWVPVATASLITPPAESLEFGLSLLGSAIVTLPVLSWIWHQLEQQNPFGILRPNPKRYDVFVHMGREDEYEHNPPIRKSETSLRTYSTDTDDSNQ
jgi:hypothetical protein